MKQRSKEIWVADHQANAASPSWDGRFFYSKEDCDFINRGIPEYKKALKFIRAPIKATKKKKGAK